MGDPPPWPPLFPLLPPVSPTGRGAAQRCADTPKGRRRLLSAPKFIDIDGKRFVWRELLQRRREQLAAAARVEQPALFELKEDCRPIPERTAAGRYSEPNLFAFIERER